MLEQETVNLRIENSQLKDNQIKLMEENQKVNEHLVKIRMRADGVITLLCEELDNKVNDIRNLKKQIELMNINGFLSTSNKELRRAILNSFNLLNCDRQRYQTVLLDEEKSLRKAKFVIDLEEEMVASNNNSKLMTLLFLTLCEQQNLSNISGPTELSDEFVGVSNELHDIITNPSLMEATSLFPISQTPQSEHDMFEKN